MSEKSKKSKKRSCDFEARTRRDPPEIVDLTRPRQRCCRCEEESRENPRWGDGKFFARSGEWICRECAPPNQYYVELDWFVLPLVRGEPVDLDEMLLADLFFLMTGQGIACTHCAVQCGVCRIPLDNITKTIRRASFSADDGDVWCFVDEHGHNQFAHTECLPACHDCGAIIDRLNVEIDDGDEYGGPYCVNCSNDRALDEPSTDINDDSDSSDEPSDEDGYCGYK